MAARRDDRPLSVTMETSPMKLAYHEIKKI